VEELVDGGGGACPSRGELDTASVHVESIEVRDGDFLVLGSHDAWNCLDGLGDEAAQAVSGWMREQEVASTQEQPGRGGQDRSLDFPRGDYQGLGFDWGHTMIPDLIRDADKMLAGARLGGNAATCVVRPELKHGADGSGGYGQDFYAAVRPRRSGPTSISE
jgi:hypothetical protein